MSRLLTSPRRRIRKAYWVSFQVVVSYLGLYLRGKLLGRAYYESRIKALHLRNAERVKQAVLELQGLFIKVGQLLSILSNFLPEEFQEPLEGLQDQVPARPIAEVRERIEKELGQTPEQLFSRFDEVPLASASIGQAHRAQLPNGEEVVIKVQHRNIEAVAAVDLQIIDRLQRIVAWWFGLKGIDYLYSQIRQMIEEELDFVREGQAMQVIGQQLEGIPKLVVPTLYQELSTGRVLTSKWCPGVKITNLQQLADWGVDRTDLAKRLVEAYCQMVFRDGYYHADPHPGNILVQEDGTLVLLDFGAVATLGPQMREGLSLLIESAVKNDVQAMIDACRSMGFIAPGHEAQRMAEQMIDALRTFLQQEVKLENLNFKDIEVDPFNNSLFDLVRNVGIGSITSTVQIPKEWVLLNRMATLLLGICNTLDDRFNPLQIVRPYVQEFVLGDKGDIVTFVTKLIRETAGTVITLPGEMQEVLRQARRGRIAVETPDTLLAARLIYFGLQQVLFAFLLVVAIGGFFYFESTGAETYRQWAIGSCVIVLLLLLRSLQSGRRARR